MTTAVKERPILMSAPMVRAILDGRKTQTRRIVKPRPPAWVEQFGFTAFTPLGSISGRGRHPEDGPAESFFRCPFGRPGDRLWVRETWAPNGMMGACWYKAGVPLYEVGSRRKPGAWEGHPAGMPIPPGIKWRPSIFMPRWASRITLEITGVRVERLRSISEVDKLAEGATPVMTFGTFWRLINSKPGTRWEDDPWVWAIAFKRLEGPGRA